MIKVITLSRIELSSNITFHLERIRFITKRIQDDIARIGSGNLFYECYHAHARVNR